MSAIGLCGGNDQDDLVTLSLTDELMNGFLIQ
jgi:hypothetical protein